MNTSQTTFLSKPAGDTQISLAELAYIRARNRQNAYNLVIREFKKSGITQSTLARRLGKGTDVISRLLKRPGNWELDTHSEMIFAITGAAIEHSLSFPQVATYDIPTGTSGAETATSNATVVKLFGAAA